MQLTVEPKCRPEVNLTFLQRMCNAMCMSLFKYGAIGDAYPHKVNAIATLKKRLELYEETGNLEWLVDVANMAMIEYTLPAHKDAHYMATDSKDSPGRKFHGELDFSKRGNKEL